MDFLAVLSLFLSANLGVPYQWGGNNPITGYDCSGFVMEYSHTMGVGPTKDSSAQGIYNWYQAHPEETIPNWATTLAGVPPLGTLVFFGASTKSITHTGVMINDVQMVEAGGGSESTLTRKEAADRDAFVRIRPFTNRKDWCAFIIPRYPPESGYYQAAGMSVP